MVSGHGVRKVTAGSVTGKGDAAGRAAENRTDVFAIAIALAV